MRGVLVTPAGLPPGPPPEARPVVRLAELLSKVDQDRSER